MLFTSSFSAVNYQTLFLVKEVKVAFIKKTYTLWQSLVITLKEDDQLKKKVNKNPKFDENFEVHR